MTRPSEHLTPSRTLPLLYFAVGSVSLAIAFAAIAVAPRSVGFFYHSRLVGIVHLVTIGWITAVLIGSIYLGLPLALKSPLPVSWRDYAACASILIGLIGMVAHFWIEEFGGMAWSGLMVAVGIMFVGARVVPRVMRADIQPGAKVPFVLAFGNIALAATAGVVLGFDKVHHFLPGYVIANVLAHAHLAAIGWASMLAIGLCHVLLPPMVGSREPRGRDIAATAAILEIAALGLFIAFVLRNRLLVVFAMCAAAGFSWFASGVLAIWRNRAAGGLPRVNVSAWHMLQGVAYSALAVALGVMLAVMEPSELTMQLALVYGFLGLGGFLAQIVMGIQMALEPRLNGSRLTFALWFTGIPVMALGLLLNHAVAVACGAWLGVAATAIGVIDAIAAVQQTFRRPAWLSLPVHDRHRRGASQQLTVPQGRV